MTRRRPHRWDIELEPTRPTRPQPFSQALWLLATVAVAAVFLSATGNSLAAADGTARPRFTGQELLDLAAPATPAAPALESLPPLIAADHTATADPAPGAAAAHGAASADPMIAAESNADDPPFTASPVLGQADGGDAHVDGDGNLHAQGHAALDTISYPWRELLPEWTITFLPARQGLYGLTLVPEKRIEIYLRDGQSMRFLAHVIAHELGHAVDVELNDSDERRRWEDSRGIASEPWWPGSGATDFSTGAGDFAEAFAAWQVGDDSFRSSLADPPTAEQIELLAELSSD